MSLRLLLDEDSQDKLLVSKLKAAGHDVLTAHEAVLSGKPDSEVLAFAVQKKRVVLTRNCNDFLVEANNLKSSGKNHCGILLRYEKNDPAKDMSYDDVVRALDNIQKAISEKTLTLKNTELSLSYYRY